MIVAVPWLAAANEATYCVPENLALALTAPNGAGPIKAHEITAEIEGRLGTLRNLAVFFTTSDDLAVAPASATVAELATGKKANFKLAVTPVKGGKAGAAGSFVKMRVVYVPDYDALAAAVADNQKYPIQTAREQLQEIVTRNELAKAPQTNVTDLRYPAAETADSNNTK